jgi:beta-lactamase regulating signal transducer with metallopeptidase domain
MPNEIFYWLLSMSILGSAAGLLILLLRRIRALPRFGIYLLWLMPLIRFLVPAGIANEYSLLSLISRYATKTVVIWQPLPGQADVTMSNVVLAAEEYFPIVYKTEALKNIFGVAGMIWMIIAAAAVLCSTIIYLYAISALRGVERVTGDIYRSGLINSPAVYGVFRQKIILPADISGADAADLDYIIRHERVHMRRRDNLWRVIAIFAACVHWFNPLAWIFLRYLLEDMELACDAGVLKELTGCARTECARTEYARVLVSQSAEKTRYASAFGGVKTRLRIESILTYKKLSLASGICFAAFFAAIAVTLITNAAG